ncbi:hypothetical protein THTE_3550 [Thermogutta terrifontis]|uniref:Uncharacterized protein n=1 Tax=Thermogutta terrifontis TaxID=1331910 RepID=A0A286RJL1_9BACT|nr:hypothetical protein [Thermogutta terrifontis]ASV76151.1 hypothetical protein THTE_3550 [Thermogutta terrifontis]
MNLVGSIALLAAFCVSAEASDYQTVVRHGDWIVTGDEIVSNQHIVLDGSLVLKEGGQLTLSNCHVELVGQKSREHIVDWQGGKLITRKTIIGGTDRAGTAIHTVFHLYDGLWDAEDTVVEFSYGISSSDKSPGILKGKRFRAGRRPDALIASGLADITLEDSVFPVALGIYTHQGGRATLNLPSNQPLDVVFDGNSLTPGVKWKLELIRTVVPRWFVFLRNIGPTNLSCEIVLEQVEDVIGSSAQFLYNGIKN